MFDKSSAAQARLHELVPGGAHTYARGSDQYPEDMAPVIARGFGARVQDLDGNTYVEYGMGLRSVTLGHGYEPVVAAVSQAISHGVSFTRPSELELRAAETFLAQVPGADMVKFAKNGSDATTAAVKLSRAATGRRRVAICRSHPVLLDRRLVHRHHADARPGPWRRSVGLTVGFDYNDLDSVRSLLASTPARSPAWSSRPPRRWPSPRPASSRGCASWPTRTASSWCSTR